MSLLPTSTTSLMEVFLSQYKRVDGVGNCSEATITRKHSNRMHTARLETVHVSVSVATTRCDLQGDGYDLK